MPKGVESEKHKTGCYTNQFVERDCAKARSPHFYVRSQMQQWDLHHTYHLVERVFGRDQVALIKPCLRSVIDRQNFALYHILETRRLLKSFKRKHLADKNLLVALHGARNPPARVPFEVLMINAGAHATACVQAIHAISDILAHGVYFATGLNLSAQPISDRDISINSVSALVKRTPSLANLADPVSRIAAGQQYEHLTALSNLSKHRTIIRTALSEDWTGKRKERYEFHFPAFSYTTKSGQKNYPEVSFASLTKAEYDRLSFIVIEVGHEINAALTKQARRSG